MQQATRTSIAALIAADPTTTPEQRRAIIRACQRQHLRRKLGTVRQAADILQVHPRTVQRYERAGLLTAVRYSPRRIRYDLDQVQRLADEGVSDGGRTPPLPPPEPPPCLPPPRPRTPRARDM